MYFNQIRFEEVRDGNVIHIPTAAKILYQDDALIISENAYHNKPHLLIDKVNYGNINFQELEIEERKGNIGLKMTADQVSVNPSREAVIWDDQTKEAIQESYQRAVESASRRIEKELLQDDYLLWLRACETLRGGYRGTDPIIKAMSGIIEMTEVNPSFRPMPDIRATFPILDWINAKTITTRRVSKGPKSFLKLERDPVYSRGQLTGEMPIYLMDETEENNTRKNKYLASKLHPQGAILLRRPSQDFDITKVKFKHDEITYVLETMGVKLRGIKEELKAKRYAENLPRAEAAIKYLYEYFGQNKPNLPLYKDVVVPDDFRVSEKEDDEDEEIVEVEEKAKDTGPSAADIRKQLSMIPFHIPVRAESQRKLSDGTYVDSDYMMRQIDVPVSTLENIPTPEIYYGSRADEAVIHMASFISECADATFQTDKEYHEQLFKRWPGTWANGGCALATKLNAGLPSESYTANHLFYGNYNQLTSDEVLTFMVAEDNVKYVRDFKHVRQFFMDLQGKTLTMSNVLRKWNTGRMVEEKLDTLHFLRNWAGINSEIHAMYTKIVEANKSYQTFSSSPKFGMTDQDKKGLLEYMDSVTKFQLFVEENKDSPALIASAAKAFLNPADGVEINDARALDTDLYRDYLNLVDWCAPVQVLLNEINWTNSRPFDRPEFEQELRSYVRSKGADILLNYKPDEQ
jgi:hypothetical protein